MYIFLKFGYEMYKLYILILSNLCREKLVKKKKIVNFEFTELCVNFFKNCVF